MQTERPQCESASRHRALLVRGFCEPVATRRGFDVQTTPLAGDPTLFEMQVDAHKEAKAELGAAGDPLRIMLSRVAYCARDEADRRKKLEMAHDYYRRFDNVFTGPGLVKDGCIAALPREQTIDELVRETDTPFSFEANMLLYLKMRAVRRG